VRAVATRDLPTGAVTPEDIVESDYVAALLEDAIRELDTRERRCVAAIGLPAASLRTLRLPRMTAFERYRTAHFEAMRYIDYPIDEAIVRIRQVGEESGLCAFGIVRAHSLKARTNCLRKAGLRPQVIDDEGCALRRAFPDYDGILDVGHFRATFYLNNSFEAFQTRMGGADITAGIESDLSLDESTAEKRKRILGTAGAGERVRAELMAVLGSLINSASAVSSVRRVAVVGNGARLPGLIADLAIASSVDCELAVSRLLNSETYTNDVISSSAADWTLAAALAR